MIYHTQVGIIGAGPAGLTLAHWLKTIGIECIIIEHRSKEYVQSRVRAGLLEQNTVDILSFLGLAGRLHKEGKAHHGVYLNFDGERIRIPFDELTGGRHITIYGQQEVIKDLTQAWYEKGGKLFFDSPAKDISSINTNQPVVHFESNGEVHELHADFIAACDGFHGLGRKYLQVGQFNEFQYSYPFHWLGILAQVAPSSEELIYSYHQNGFALHSMRSDTISRLYIQISSQDSINQWPDERIWEELAIRLATPSWTLKSGPIIEKTITPMRSFMIDRLQQGRLFLAGDSAHIVPPTGGKGLNLAIADVKQLVDGFVDFYQNNSIHTLENYTSLALPRIWRAQDFSNFMTTLLHKQHEHGSFDYHLQKAKFNYIKSSKAFATTIAENYVGLPF